MDSRHGPADFVRSAVKRVQDMPPPGGYPEARYVRNLPQRGPTPYTFFAIISLAGAYGFYKVITGNRRRRDLKEEKIAARRIIFPLLQAERDVAAVEAKRAEVAREAEIMKNVPGWVVGQSVYNSRQ